MTDRNKFEQMLEALINEETEKAKEIFHDIVVEKSRDIYESLLESDFTEEEDPMAAANAEMPEDETAMEAGDEEEEEGSEEEGGDDEFGGDEEDAGADMGEEEQTDRILDLEDALEELKAEFEALMADEEGGEMDDMGDIGGDATDDFMGDIEDEPVDEFAFEDGEEEEEEGTLREYTEKVGNPKHGDNGVNTKSPVAKPNNMGGTTANIAKGGESTTGGTKGGLLNPSTKEEDFGNLNTAKSPKGSKAFSTKVPAGHGAEKKGSGEHADNKKSIIGGK